MKNIKKKNSNYVLGNVISLSLGLSGMLYIFYNAIISIASIGVKLNEEEIAVINTKDVIVNAFKWIAIDSIIAIVLFLIFSGINYYLVKKERTGLLKVFVIFSIVILTFCIIKAIIMCI